MDEELKRFIYMKQQEEHLNVFMCITELQKSYNIEEYKYKDGILMVKVGKWDWLRIKIKEDTCTELQ